GAGPREDLYYPPESVNVGVVVSGGTCPGVNAMIHWLVYRHHETYNLRTGCFHVYGFLNGFKGLSGELGLNYVSLNPDQTRERMHEPGSMIGQSRYEADVPKMVNTLKEMGVHILYVIGGDGSLEGAHKIAMEVQRQQLKIAVVGIPKTIDNDILWCWDSPGFETAVNEVAKAVDTFHFNIKANNRIG